MVPLGRQLAARSSAASRRRPSLGAFGREQPLPCTTAAMGAATSTLIDELHTSAQLPDESGLARKLHVLRKAQELAKTALISRQIVEQGGLQPLTRCVNSVNPVVRTEAAKALAILARQPKNRPEIAQDDCLPLLVPSLLTGDEAFKEHAMHVLAEIAEPEANKMRIVHEGLLGPIIGDVTAQGALQLHALQALARLCEMPVIAILAAQRDALAQVLRAARGDSRAVKLGTVCALAGLASVGENLSQFVTSGAIVFLIGARAIRRAILGAILSAQFRRGALTRALPCRRLHRLRRGRAAAGGARPRECARARLRRLALPQRAAGQPVRDAVQGGGEPRAGAGGRRDGVGRQGEREHVARRAIARARRADQAAPELRPIVDLPPHRERAGAHHHLRREHAADLDPRRLPLDRRRVGDAREHHQPRARRRPPVVQRQHRPADGLQDAVDARDADPLDARPAAR